MITDYSGNSYIFLKCISLFPDLLSNNYYFILSFDIVRNIVMNNSYCAVIFRTPTELEGAIMSQQMTLSCCSIIEGTLLCAHDHSSFFYCQDHRAIIMYLWASYFSSRFQFCIFKYSYFINSRRELDDSNTSSELSTQ